jgi:hypothetical protein
MQSRRVVRSSRIRWKVDSKDRAMAASSSMMSSGQPRYTNIRDSTQHQVSFIVSAACANTI